MPFSIRSQASCKAFAADTTYLRVRESLLCSGLIKQRHHRIQTFKVPSPSGLTSVRYRLGRSVSPLIQSTASQTAHFEPSKLRSDSTERSHLPSKPAQPYSWTKQWYPVAIVADLPTDRPTAIKLLGKDLVIWTSGRGQWQCFDNICPHRSVPLSEGRIESDNTLQCAYHGWRFDSEGHCTKVPQAESKDEESRIMHQSKACVAIFPTQIQQDVLWVWADASPNAKLDCLAKQPIDDGAWFDKPWAFVLHPWFMRELPYGQDVLLENLVDPSHVEYAHHAVFGGRDEHLISRMSIAEAVQPEIGCAVHVRDTTEESLPDDSPVTRKIEFKPPTLVRYQFITLGMQLILYCTPTTPGHSRILYTMLADRNTFARDKQLIAAMTPSWMTWAIHLGRNDTLDGC